MTELTSLTLAQARDRLRNKEITAAELTDAHIGAVEAARALNAFVKETPEHARAMARVSDAKLQKGEGGPLEGIPLGIKDLFCTKGVRTTAGSKILADFTATVGWKPAYGRCSRWGIVAFASSLDQAGPIARTVRDTALLMRSMAGHDPKDTTSVDLPVPDYEASLGHSVKGMKIGIPKEYRLDGMPAEIETLWQQGIAWLKDAGAEMVDVSLPHTKYALPAYYIVAPAEASSNLARYDGVRYGLRVAGRDITDLYEKTRADGFGKE